MQYDGLLHYNHCIFFALVSIRNQIVTGFNLYPDATCRVRRQHRPISSNRTQSNRNRSAKPWNPPARAVDPEARPARASPSRPLRSTVHRPPHASKVAYAKVVLSGGEPGVCVFGVRHIARSLSSFTPSQWVLRSGGRFLTRAPSVPVRDHPRSREVHTAPRITIWQ